MYVCFFPYFVYLYTNVMGQMEPELIKLSPLFIRLLRVSTTTAYALRPCFATRLDVYSASTGSEGGWMPCALLVSQGGEMYLFSAEDGRVINAALLSPGKITNTEKARIDIVTQQTLDAETDTQSMYIRCRQQLQVMNSGGEGKGKGLTPYQSVAVSDKAPGALFPPFSYLMRFHCRNAQVMLQFFRIITNFADPKKKELNLRRTNISLRGELDHSLFIDPLITAPWQPEREQQRQDTNKWSNALSKVSPFKLLSRLPGARNTVYMRDIAKFEKKRLLDIGERIEVPLLADSILSLKPNSVGEANSAHAIWKEAPTEASPGRNEYAGAMANALLAKEGDPSCTVLPAVAKFYGLVLGKIPQFTLPSSEDVLCNYGLPGFESQFAVFFVKPHIQNIVENSVGQLLANFPGLPDLPQYRIITREAVREEMRWNFGVTYRELCDAARKFIDGISIDQLVIDEERATIQKSHDMAVQALLAEFEARWQKMVEEEGHVFFDANHEPKSVTTGQLLAPVCAEETEWRNEVAEAAEALEALELGIQRIRNTMVADSDEDNDDSSEKQDISGNNVGGVAFMPSRGEKGGNPGHFSSLREEAAFLLQEIQREQETLLSIQLQYSSGDLGSKDIVEDDLEIQSMRSEHNARLLQQQQQIDTLKQELQKSAAMFGINARWIEEQNRRPGPVQGLLNSPYIV
ncbi:hypothetical protein MOQ_000493 [Trypanosoma cruzi marinkellei]|uniref:Uncharacterized protein n=1 Tax=Trypanosoma cruzi marinkellei TaxID=85056 RepID=K2NW62_TRYCR|nr:hypothetical protein MOQ_000493 [Trypanosoma cruzi marinkellei]